jgi:vacuolar-type H+-ATPase subunit I/STV1
LPHRFRAKFPDTQGNRYYKKGRFISLYYDASPATMKQVQNLITMDDTVLRQTHLKARSVLDYINNPNEKKNPYIRRVLLEEAFKMSAGTEQDEASAKLEQEFQAFETLNQVEAEAMETIEELEAEAQEAEAQEAEAQEAEAQETIEQLEAEAQETIQELEAGAQEIMEELEAEAITTVEEETKNDEK